MFQDVVKYNQITTAVGQYLTNSNVITEAIKGHLDKQDKTTQETKEVPKEVRTLIKNMICNETSKQYQAKFRSSTSIAEENLANIEHTATNIVLSEAKKKSPPKPKKKREFNASVRLRARSSQKIKTLIFRKRKMKPRFLKRSKPRCVPQKLRSKIVSAL